MKHNKDMNKIKTPMTPEEKKKTNRILIGCGILLVISIIVLTVSLVAMQSSGCVGVCS